MKRQSIKNKKGEVNYRRKLALQFEGKKTYYPGQPDKKEYLKLLKERVDQSRDDFIKLEDKGVKLSPYLEIGAERGQRSLLLENEFEAEGIATDISLESLSLADILLKPLRYKKMPIRVVCDANSLPFRSNSIPFIFCYQTLHHFPDPKPVIHEIKRVLAPGGYFYFNEEPVKQWLNLRLWSRDYNLTPLEKLLKAIGMLPFLSTIGGSEKGEGVLEEEFDINTWERALDVFDEAEASVYPFPFGPISKSSKGSLGWLNPNPFTRVIVNIAGGGIEAICQKKSGGKKYKSDNMIDYLTCPNCSKPATLQNGKLVCNSDKIRIKTKGGIHILLSRDQENNLYA